MAWSEYEGRRRVERPSREVAREWASAVLTRDRHLCRLRLKGCLGVATEADHIVPVTEGGEYVLSNGQAVCTPCHKIKTQEEAQRGRARWKRGPARHPGLDPL